MVVGTDGQPYDRAFNKVEQAERPVYGKIKFLRDVFGISESGFRLYEKEGLARSSRNAENNYRVSTLCDGVLMCSAFSLAHYGLPLKRTREVILEGGVEDQVSALEGLNDDLNDQLMEIVARKAHIEAELRALGRYASNPLSCRVVDDAGFVMLPIHTQQIELLSSFEDSSAWWEHAPLVNAGMLIELDEGWSTADLLHGPVASESDAARLRLPMRHAVRFDEARRQYLHAFITLPADSLPFPETFAHIARYMDANGLTMGGRTVMTRLLRYQDAAGGGLRTDEVFIPLA